MDNNHDRNDYLRSTSRSSSDNVDSFTQSSKKNDFVLESRDPRLQSSRWADQQNQQMNSNVTSYQHLTGSMYSSVSIIALKCLYC